MEGHHGFLAFLQEPSYSCAFVYDSFLESMGPAPSKNLQCGVSNRVPWAKTLHVFAAFSLLEEECAVWAASWDR